MQARVKDKLRPTAWPGMCTCGTVQDTDYQKKASRCLLSVTPVALRSSGDAVLSRGSSA